MKRDSDYLKYFMHNDEDEKWGIVCTTVGFQEIEPNSPYPLSSHPSAYNFTRNGRVLDEYQIVYITKGSGTFSSDTVKNEKVQAGDVIMLCPGERHTYRPEVSVGWMEVWVGFKGTIIDKLAKGPFIKSCMVKHIGIKEEVINHYKSIIELAKEEKSGVQQAVAGEIFSLIGRIHYESLNYFHRNNKNVDKIERAKIILKDNLSSQISPADVADEIGVSYSLLRNQFKAITGISMSSYLIRQRLVLAKTMLSSTNKSIQEIADETGFESLSRFCCSFKQHVGMTASQFRERNFYDISQTV